MNKSEYIKKEARLDGPVHVWLVLINLPNSIDTEEKLENNVIGGIS